MSLVQLYKRVGIIFFFFFLGIRKYKEVLFVLTLENYKRLLGEKKL